MYNKFKMNEGKFMINQLSFLFILIVFSNKTYSREYKNQHLDFDNKLNSSVMNDKFEFINDYIHYLNKTIANGFLRSGEAISANMVNNFFGQLNIKLSSPINDLKQFQAGEIIYKEEIDNNFELLRIAYQTEINDTSIGYNQTITTEDLTGITKTISFYNKDVDFISTTEVLNCFRNEFCKVTFNSNSFSQDLGTIHYKNGTSKTLQLSSGQDTSTGTVPHRTADYGCANADNFSSSTKNIFACDGSGATCTRFCHTGSCYSTPQEAFNKWNLTEENRYYYSSWAKTTGDLRDGCGGKFVYGFKVDYYKRKFYLTE